VTIDAPKENVTYEVTIENYLGRDVGVTIVSPRPGESGKYIHSIFRTLFLYDKFILQNQLFGYCWWWVL
jgi:hypothetical protein